MLESLNQPNLYRGPASSKEFNMKNKLLKKDIASMYHLLNENEENITKNMDIVLRENFFMNYKINLLERELEKIRSLVENNTDTPYGDYTRSLHVQNFHTSEGLEDGDDDRKATINRQFGVVMPLSTDIISRFGYTTDSGEVFIPNSLEMHLKEGNDTRLDEYGDVILEDVITNDMSAIVDRNNKTFWLRTVTHPTHESVHEIFGELHILIPTEGFQNIYTNTLKIAPYPEGSMRIHDITYKGYGDQWSRLETYPTVDNQPQVIENTNKLLFQFPNTEMIELKISFSQPYWFENENKSQFTYGFQDISLEYHNYTEKVCEFITKIDLTPDNTKFKRVQEPIAVPALGTNQDIIDMVSFELYYDADLTVPFNFGSDILSDVQTIYVKTLLSKEGNTIPVLKEIQIPYVYDDI